MKNILHKFKKRQQGISLLELIVSMGIFVIVTLLVNGIYINIVNSQKQAIASQITQESFRFAFEVMSKEIRAAQGVFEGSDCPAPPNTNGYYKIFNNAANNDEKITGALYFKNVEGQCVIYDMDNNRLRINRGGIVGYITPDELKFLDLKFSINDGLANAVGVFQPTVTIMAEAEMKNLPTEHIRMQTTISSREYTY